MYTIEKNIMPHKITRNNLTTLIRSMEVGDSFVCELSKRGSMPQLFINTGYRCRTSKLSDNEVRVWRVL